MVVETVEINFAKEYGVTFDDIIPISYSWCRKSKKQEPARPSRDHIVHRQLRVLAINTCPKKEKGDIARLLDPYLEGIKTAGAEVELYYARDLTIFPCCGNLNCTVRTPGNCMAYDDMRWLRQKIGLADVLVLASPLYFNGTIGPDGATASLRSLLGRLVPGHQLSTEVQYEHAIHTTKEAVNLRKTVFVSGCGFWEVEDLYPVLTHIKALCYNTFPDFAGNITGTHGVLLGGALEGRAPRAEVVKKAKEAGRQLVLDRRSTPAELIARESLTDEIYRKIMGSSKAGPDAR